MRVRHTSPPLWLFGIIILLVVVLMQRQTPTSARGAFLTDTDNRIGNPSLEMWDLVTNLPEEWSVTGWSGSGTWDELSRTTSPVHNGTYSAGFLNKGLGLSPTPGPEECDDWCIWYTAMTYVGSDQPLNARIWFYPVSFVNHNASTTPLEGVRLTLRYYNKTGTSCGSAGFGGNTTINGSLWCYHGSGNPDGKTGADYHLRGPDFAVSAWKEINFTNRRSPSNASHARFYLEIGTNLDTDGAGPDKDNRFQATFYLDEPWIEAENFTPECQDGQVQECTAGGTPGNQTCVNGRWSACEICLSSYLDCGAWSACTGGVRSHECADITCGRINQTITESCSLIQNSIDDFITGAISMPALLGLIAAYRDEGAAVVPDPTLVARFDAQYAAHPPRNTRNWYGWEGARAQHSLLTMYDVTRDTAYLDRFLALATVQRENWPAGWSGGNWQDDTAQSGNVISAYVRFAYYVLRGNLAAYTAQAEEYYDFSRANFLNHWVQIFKPFTLGGQPVGCIPTIYANGTWVCDRWNAVSGIAEALLYADLYSPNATYQDVAIRQARMFKVNLHLVAACDGTGQRYEWGYRVGNTGQPGDVMPLGTTGGACDPGTHGWGRWECGDEEEVFYAVYELGMVHTFWRQGLVFTDADLGLFTNTFIGMWNNDTAEPNRMAWVRCWSESSQPDMHNAYMTGYFQGFARFGNRDSALLAAYDTISGKLAADLVGHATGDSSYYQCVTKADQSRVCYSTTTLGREMYLQGTADLLATHYDRP